MRPFDSEFTSKLILVSDGNFQNKIRLNSHDLQAFARGTNKIIKKFYTELSLWTRGRFRAATGRMPCGCSLKICIILDSTPRKRNRVKRPSRNSVFSERISLTSPRTRTIPTTATRRKSQMKRPNCTCRKRMGALRRGLTHNFTSHYRRRNYKGFFVRAKTTPSRTSQLPLPIPPAQTYLLWDSPTPLLKKDLQRLN
jgi:hypothetical protein